jgi:hypothetical protein
MLLVGCQPAINNSLFKVGIDLTNDSFILNNFIYYKRFEQVISIDQNVVNYPPSPSMTEHITASYFVYDVTEKRSSKISSTLFYKSFMNFKQKEHTINDLNTLLDLVLEDFFVQYTWLNSIHLSISNYETNTKQENCWNQTR